MLETLPSSAAIDELRVVANAVKARGRHLPDALHDRFPRYFDDPSLVEGITLSIGPLVGFWSEFKGAGPVDGATLQTASLTLRRI